MHDLGRLFLTLGGLLLLIGVLLLAAAKIPEPLRWIGRLPGDIFIQRKNFSFYFPLTTGILVSILLTLLFSLFLRR